MAGVGTGLESDAVPPDGPHDGRTARRDRNRAAVVAAAIALFDEGDGFASLQAIADRAGVSLRSLHRYFEDADDLVAAALDAYLGALEPLLVAALPPVDRPLADRVDAWVGNRLEANAHSAQAILAASARAHTSPRVAAVFASRRHTIVERLRAVFAPELAALSDADRDRTVAAMHTLTSAQTYATVMWRHGVPDDAARRHMTHQATTLLLDRRPS
jgi:AcrR family transcriptional regulator